MKPEDRCGWPCEITPECLDFRIGEEVETPFSGEWTRHQITNRYRTNRSMSRVVYEVSPPVPKSYGWKLFDAAWFRKVSSE